MKVLIVASANIALVLSLSEIKEQLRAHDAVQNLIGVFSKRDLRENCKSLYLKGNVFFVNEYQIGKAKAICESSVWK